MSKKFKKLDTIFEENLSYYFNQKHLKTGDVILFTSHSGIISKIINFWTKSEYVHVGIVIKDVENFLKLNQNKKYKFNIKCDDTQYDCRIWL